MDMDMVIPDAGNLILWTDEEEQFFFGGLSQLRNNNSGGQFTCFPGAEVDEVFAVFTEELDTEELDVRLLEASEVQQTGGEVDDEKQSSGDEMEEVLQGRRPTPEQVAVWQRNVVEVGRQRVWQAHTDRRFQARCFAVEWRSSALVDGKEFVRRLFRVVGGDASFVLGMDIRKSRADYCLVVRLAVLARWRDWRKVLMFGHGAQDDEEGLFVRVRVPRRRKTDEDINAFVREMLRKCDTYDETCRYKEAGLIRLQGRREKAAGSAGEV
jgi:hypothetical protein